MRELPRGWVETTLDALCEFNPKHNSEADRSLKVNFIPMPAVDDETGTIVDTSNVRPLSEVWKGYTHFSDRDVIFAKITPCMENGKIAVARGLTNGMACGSTEFHVLRPTGALEPDYLWRFLRRKNYRQIAERSMTGAVGQRRVPKQFLEATALPLPPLAEQKRIVAELDTLNAKSARARTELARIETLVSRYKQAVLSNTFNGELLSSKVRFGEYIQTAGNGLSKRQGDEGEWTNVLRLADLNQGQFSPVEPRQIRLNDKEANKYGLTKGDLVLIRVNGSTNLVGRSFCFKAETRWAFCDHFIRIKLKPSFDPDFAALYINSPLIRLIVEHKFVSTSGQKTISQRTLEELPAPQFSLEAQHEIVRRIASAFDKINRLAVEARRALKLVGRLDEAILERAFRGELVPQDENDEPAENLLERIRAERASTTKRGRGAKQ